MNCNAKVLFSLVFYPAFISLLVISIHSHAQVNYKKEFHRVSCPEKWWAIFHPFIAKKAFRLTEDARLASREAIKNQWLDNDENGGQVDAFRHAYWMALLSQNFCWRKARWLGRAHEKGNYIDFKKHRLEEGALPDSASGAMDLYNNTVGIEIGRAFKKTSPEELKMIVRDSVITGKMKVIYKNRNGEAMDCDSKVIDTEKYKQQWNIPKCIMNSNYR